MDLIAPYAYWLYFLYANITSLNNWRHERGFSSFSFLSPPRRASLISPRSQAPSGSALTPEKQATPTTSPLRSSPRTRSRTASCCAKSRRSSTSSTSSRLACVAIAFAASAR